MCLSFILYFLSFTVFFIFFTLKKSLLSVMAAYLRNKLYIVIVISLEHSIQSLSVCSSSSSSTLFVLF